MRKCDKCKNITDLFFCPQCGSVIEYQNFVQDNVSLKENLRLYIEDLVNTAQKKKIEITDYANSSKLAETLYRHYYEHITLLHKMCEKEPVNNIFSSSISLFKVIYLVVNVIIMDFKSAIGDFSMKHLISDKISI